MAGRTNKQLVFEAVEDLHRLEQIVTRETLADHTGLKLSIIDDRLKALVIDGMIVRVQRGVFVPVVQHPPARPISHTELPDGTVVLDIGDDVMKLTPREARTLGAMLGGRAIQASQVDLGNQAAYANSELSARLRQVERFLNELSAPAPQTDPATTK
jgi:hypothetical protein